MMLSSKGLPFFALFFFNVCAIPYPTVIEWSGCTAAEAPFNPRSAGCPGPSGEHETRRNTGGVLRLRLWQNAAGLDALVARAVNFTRAQPPGHRSLQTHYLPLLQLHLLT